MKFKIFIWILFLFFCITPIHSVFVVQSNISCSGGCSIVQITNNKDMEIKSDGGIKIDSDIHNEKENISINSTGGGNIKIKGKGNHKFFLKYDDQTSEKEGSGLFEIFYSFFQQINFFGLFLR